MATGPQGMSIRVEGVAELGGALQELPDSVRGQVLRNMLTLAARPTIARPATSALRAAIVGPDRGVAKSLRRTGVRVTSRLTRRQQRYRRVGRDDVAVYIGPTAPNAHLIEFGTAPRVQRKTGRYTGRVQARPFLRPAWDAGKAQFLASLGTMLGRALERKARQLVRRADRLLTRGR